jgi:ADP-ribosylation factor-binding protein GGA
VKKRCIELLYCWSEGLPLKTKIREAYEMLKKQGIVESDPAYVEKLVINVAPRPKNAVFDNEEKSRQLAQLLKSKNPQDLEAANRLIKNMVRQDEIKIEKQSTRINELELMNNNVKLLNDMLLNYNQKLSSESEKETIKVVFWQQYIVKNFYD